MLKRDFLRIVVAVLGLSSLSACTFNIQPAAPSFTPVASRSSALNRRALLLMPQEFVDREYISSFEGREVRLKVGLPAARAIESIVRSRIAQMDLVHVSGDGSIDFIRLAQKHDADKSLIIRPRFIRLESSVKPFRYNIEFGVALDIAGGFTPVAPSGIGVGTASFYSQSAIQAAADTALSKAVTSLDAAFPTTCQ